MRAGETAGIGVLGAAALVATTLGLHGLHHPGPLLALSGSGIGVAAAVAPSSGGSATASAHSGNRRGATASPPARRSGPASSVRPGGHPSANKGTGAGAGKGAAGGAPVSTLRATTTLLSATQYAPYAVPVYPTRVAAASQALDGFSLKILPDGPLSDQLQVFVAGSPTAAVDQVIARTDKVYFVEGSLGDDGPGIDTNGGDDGLVVTNTRGYILQ